MYRIADYTAVNNQGTANLLQAILDTRSRPEKIVVASSMSIYGEGDITCPQVRGGRAAARAVEQLKNKRWETMCPTAMKPGRQSRPRRRQAAAMHFDLRAFEKRSGRNDAAVRTHLWIPVVALRYFNIYGTRQSLSNPYTGVAAIFASRLMNGNSPMFFEDGYQMRDFVSVHDIVQANLLAMESSAAMEER